MIPMEILYNCFSRSWAKQRARRGHWPPPDPMPSFSLLLCSHGQGRAGHAHLLELRCGTLHTSLSPSSCTHIYIHALMHTEWERNRSISLSCCCLLVAWAWLLCLYRCVRIFSISSAYAAIGKELAGLSCLPCCHSHTAGRKAGYPIARCTCMYAAWGYMFIIISSTVDLYPPSQSDPI